MSELSRGHAGKPHALAREVGLVGVAGVEGRPASSPPSAPGEEAAEAQDALERLRAVAHGRVEAPAQLALAQAELLGELHHPCGGVGQQARGLLHGRVGRPGEREASGAVGHAA